MRATNTQSLTDGELFSIIEHGIRLTGMPAGNGTPEGERDSWGLVHFVRRLPKLTPAEIERMESLNPKTPAQLKEKKKHGASCRGSRSARHQRRRRRRAIRTDMNSHRFTSNAFEWCLSPHLRQRACRRRRRGGTWIVADDCIGARDAPVAWTTFSGTEFDLRIGETPMNFTGSPSRDCERLSSGAHSSLEEGDTVTMRVANTLDEDASIHWHGILLPANMDESRVSASTAFAQAKPTCIASKCGRRARRCTHSHSGFQEQRGLYGPLVIEPREPSPFKNDREHVVMLTDWTDENPARVFAKLKKRSDYYNFHQRTVGDFFRDVRTQGLKQALVDRKMWGEMRMNPTDLADVSGYLLPI